MDGDERDDEPELTSRRTVLRLTTLAGGFGMFPAGVSASSTPNRAEQSASDAENVVLGDFESDLDGWKTNGGNDLTRVTAEEFPAGVVSGEHGLVVEVNGDAYPMIENKRRVRDADFQSHPYLQLHVLALAEDTDSDLVFQFRLHHTAKGGNGAGRSNRGNGGGSSRSKDVLVAESAAKTVPQLQPLRLQWDMSELSDEVLRTAKRLEVVWYLADHEPDGGPRGNSKGDFDYRGLVVVDDARLSASQPVSESDKQQRKKIALHREHGMIVDRVFEERTEGFERGTLVFVDGAEITYEYETLDDGGYRYAIDGETFVVEGGEGDE